MNTLFHLAAFTVLCGLSAAATDIAHLRNGFNIRHERREVAGSATRLFLGDSHAGYVEVATAEIESYEHEESMTLPAMGGEGSISQHVANASNTYGVDADFLNSVIRRESGFNPKAVSAKGARGLMQLMPQTASKLGVRDSFDPAANIDGGTRYLRELLVRYNGDAVKALAAYNAGPQRVDRYKGVPPYRETRTYVATIIRDYNRAKLNSKQRAARNGSESRTEVRAGD